MSFLAKILGDPNEKYLQKIQPLIGRISSLECEVEKFSTNQLKQKTAEFKQRLLQGESLDDILPEAFALVREGAKRTLGQRHFDVQMIGAFVLHQGKIAEMKTGEGKTLAATPGIYLNALSGNGVHVVTVNDYLAKRDAVWMGQIYNALGLSVGCIVHDNSYIYDPEYRNQNANSKSDLRDEERDRVGGFKVLESYLCPCSRKEAYLADITYGTNNEFGFDYLRDNLVFDFQGKVQRGFNYAIVDEVDSILIDEARTPLIISEPDFESSKLYQDFARLIPQLKENIDYNMDEKMRVATLTEQGIERIEKILGLSNIYAERGFRYLHYLEQSLRARAFFHKDKDYIVKSGQIIIIDEFTGRLLPGRRYSGGLHQAIEAKEAVEVQPESKILATITFQNYFRMYKKLAGMTGTALTSAEELDKVYHLSVIAVPTNKPTVRQDLSDKIYKTEKAKFRAVVAEIKQRHQKGQPVLVGTRSVEKNEYLGKLLSVEGIKHQILNAKNHQNEGEIIAQAGRVGAVTVATNMAGRGVDIILGGNPPDDAETKQVKAAGGLHVIGTERNEARRIDNQLRGRAGRQGDVGSSQFFISLEDELIRIFGGDRIKSLMDMMKVEENQPLEARIISSAIEKAQARVEGMNFDARHHLLEYDDVISKQRNKIYSQRNEILTLGYEQLKGMTLDILQQEISGIILNHFQGEEDKKEIVEEVRTIFPSPPEASDKLKGIHDLQEAIDYLSDLAKAAFSAKEEAEGPEDVHKVLRFAFLKTIDMFWTEHLVSLEYLKDSVSLRAYGGRDPLVEYKTEGHKMFQDFWRSVNAQVARTIFKLSVSKSS